MVSSVFGFFMLVVLARLFISGDGGLNAFVQNGKCLFESSSFVLLLSKYRNYAYIRGRHSFLYPVMKAVIAHKFIVKIVK